MASTTFLVGGVQPGALKYDTPNEETIVQYIRENDFKYMSRAELELFGLFIEKDEEEQGDLIRLQWKNDILGALQELYENDAAVQEDTTTYEYNDLNMYWLKAECRRLKLKIGGTEEVSVQRFEKYDNFWAAFDADDDFDEALAQELDE